MSNKLTLAEAVINIQPDSSWAVYAQEPHTPDSPARYGQTQFPNGGTYDDMSEVVDGEQASAALEHWLALEEGENLEDALEHLIVEDFVDSLLDEIE